MKPNIYMFADDTKIFNTINSEVDTQVLQNDLQVLEEWSVKWQLRLHISRESVPEWKYKIQDKGILCVTSV